VLGPAGTQQRLALPTWLLVCLLQAQQGRPPFACAHGGDTAVHPPNTAAAYAAALVHTDCIEVDASLTSDHQLVAMHDRDLEQLLNKPGAKVGVLNFKVVFCVLLHNAVTRAMNDRDLEQLLNKPGAKVCNICPEVVPCTECQYPHVTRSAICRPAVGFCRPAVAFL
jgi:glycerophosphoryl diester phosphodiesterase